MIFLKQIRVFSWIVLNVLVSPKINNIGFGVHGHVRKSRNHENEEFDGSHISKSKSYKFKLKRNNSTEHLSISFHKFTLQIAQQSQQMKHAGCFVFSRLSIRDPAFFRLYLLAYAHPGGPRRT